MTTLTKFAGWDLDTTLADEPRVRDLDIAVRAGLSRPRDIRQLIERNWETLTAFGEIRVCVTTPQTSGGRPGREYWLSEEQAVSLVSMVKTPAGRQLHVALVKLFVAFRRGQVVATSSLTPTDLAHGPHIGDVPALRDEAFRLAGQAAKVTGTSVPRVHGHLRRSFRVPSIYGIAVGYWQHARRSLVDLIVGRVVLRRPRRQLPPDRRQLDLFGGGGER